MTEYNDWELSIDWKEVALAQNVHFHVISSRRWVDGVVTYVISKKTKSKTLAKSLNSNTIYVNPVKTRFVFHQIVSQEFLLFFPLSQVYARLPVCPRILLVCIDSSKW